MYLIIIVCIGQLVCLDLQRNCIIFVEIEMECVCEEVLLELG